MESKKTKKDMSVVINAELCKGCGYCEEQCPKKVFDTSSELNTQGYHYRVAARTQDCIGCLTCLMICPDFAVTVSEAGKESAS